MYSVRHEWTTLHLLSFINMVQKLHLWKFWFGIFFLGMNHITLHQSFLGMNQSFFFFKTWSVLCQYHTRPSSFFYDIFLLWSAQFYLWHLNKHLKAILVSTALVGVINLSSLMTFFRNHTSNKNNLWSVGTMQHYWENPEIHQFN